MREPAPATPATSSRRMRRMVLALGILLAVLHQDWWFQHDTTIVLGFIPISLFYHLCFSVAVAGLWGLMSATAWPAHIEVFAAGGAPNASESPEPGEPPPGAAGTPPSGAESAQP